LHYERAADAGPNARFAEREDVMDAPVVTESRFESVTGYLGWDHDRG
jgi:hypothetical protein